ncbi:MAG: MFS transporter [Pseudomonadota bacterium]
MTELAAESGQRRAPPTQIAAAGAAGNVMEWFDFAIYGYMAPFLSQIFFPSDDPLASLLAVYGAFAAGYLARPIGGMVFGHLGDTLGRKFVMIASVTVMGLCTVAIGLLPTYEQIGPLAAVILVVLRILQGLSVGGEYTGSTVFVAEQAPAKSRGLLTSFVVSGAIGGFLLGSAVAALLTNIYSDDQMSDFIWRIPFLAGVLIMIVGLLIRRTLDEVEPPAPEVDLGPSPVLYAFRYHWREMVRVGMLAMGANAGFYILFVFAVSYLTDRMHISTANAMDINTLCMVLLAIIPIISAALSDRIGRKSVLLTATLLLVVCAYPLWSLMHHQDLTQVLLGQLGFALIVGVILGVNPVTMAESVPSHVRVSVMSVGYNVPLAVFGGTAPAVSTYLIERTGDDFSPVYYLMALSTITLIAVITLPETFRRGMGSETGAPTEQ